MPDDDTPLPAPPKPVSPERQKTLETIAALQAFRDTLGPRLARLHAQAEQDMRTGPGTVAPATVEELASIQESLGELLAQAGEEMEVLRARMFAQAEMFYFHVLDLAKQGDARAAEIAADLTPGYLASFPVEETQLPS